MERKEKEEQRLFRFKGKPLKGYHCLEFKKAQEEETEKVKCGLAQSLMEIMPTLLVDSKRMTP